MGRVSGGNFLPVAFGNAPAAPAGTLSAAMVMAGLAIPFTPTKTGKLWVVITGAVGIQTATTLVTVSGQYGVGAAPVNGAAQVGTTFHQGQVNVRPANFSPTPNASFTVADVITGLALGVAVWFDLAFMTGNAADQANLGSLQSVIMETA